MSDIESNCFENISNRHELTATEQRKKDSDTNPTDHRNIGRRPLEEAQKPDSLFKRKMWSTCRWRTTPVGNSRWAYFLCKLVSAEIRSRQKLKEHYIKWKSSSLTKPRKLD